MDVCNRRKIRPLDHKIANNQQPLTETRHPPQPYSLKIIFFRMYKNRAYGNVCNGAFKSNQYVYNQTPSKDQKFRYFCLEKCILNNEQFNIYLIYLKL